MVIINSLGSPWAHHLEYGDGLGECEGVGERAQNGQLLLHHVVRRNSAPERDGWRKDLVATRGTRRICISLTP